MQPNVDRIAETLRDMGAKAAWMPQGFLAHGQTLPLVDAHGGRLGDMLPGIGVRLDVDLNSLGITRPIPNVYDRTRFCRAAERALQLFERLARDDRGAITTYDGILASRAGGKADDTIFQKLSFTTVATTWFTTFRAGGNPTAGSYTPIPGGAAFNNTSAGALSAALSNPSGGDTKYLLGLGFIATALNNCIMVVDLLVGAGSISATTNSAQTINTTPLTRYTTGAGVYAALEVTTALGSTPANLTIGYTNQAGTNSRTSVSTAMTASAIVQRIQPSLVMPQILMQAGDTGIRSVETLTLSASMGGSGVLALWLYKPLVVSIGTAANVFIGQDLATQVDGLTELVTEAGGALGCLALLNFPNGSSAGDIGGQLKTCAG